MMEQIICRLTYEEKQAFQMKCLQENKKMQTVLKDAVVEFTKKSATTDSATATVGKSEVPE